MKQSPYNRFFEVKGGEVVLAYNSYSGAVAEIDKENCSRVKHLLEYPEQAESPQDAAFVQCLQEGRFLIPDMVDQLAALRVRARAARLEGAVLTLTIAPTLACNFACDYCFESRSNVRMSTETQEALLRFCDYHLRKAEALRVCWFGGEPTLCFPVIEHLQNQLMKLAEKHRVDFAPGLIITNGYLLNAPMARRLRELRVAQAQITIDGPRAVHDSRRKLRSGGGTFDRVMDNLSSAVDFLRINVRINIDRDNVDSAYEVVELLEQRGILPKVRVTFGQVKSSGHACSDVRDRCYDTKEFAHTLVQIHSQLVSRGINRADYPRNLGGAACGALSEGYFVVSPTGFLFKCWEDLSVDARRSIGDLFSLQPTPEQIQNLEVYRNWDPFKLAGCRECEVLPICMGGCPLSGIEKSQTSTGVCSTWKHNFEELLELAYANSEQRVAQR